MNTAGIPVPQEWRELYIVRSLTVAERNYVPKFLDGRLVIFRGAGIYDHDPGMGWSKMAEEVEDYVIGAAAQQKTRRDILNEPLVELVAAQLKKSMYENRTQTEKPRSAVSETSARSTQDVQRPQDAA